MLGSEIAAVLVERVILNVRPLGQLALANGANKAVLLASMLLHVQEAVAFKVADFALELDNAGVNAFMRCNLQVFRVATALANNKNGYKPMFRL